MWSTPLISEDDEPSRGEFRDDDNMIAAPTSNNVIGQQAVVSSRNDFNESLAQAFHYFEIEGSCHDQVVLGLNNQRTQCCNPRASLSPPPCDSEHKDEHAEHAASILINLSVAPSSRRSKEETVGNAQSSWCREKETDSRLISDNNDEREESSTDGHDTAPETGHGATNKVLHEGALPEITSQTNDGRQLPALPKTLSHHDDAMYLNKLHCFIRSELLEVFEVTGATPGLSANNCDDGAISKKHFHGRVGLRCRYCAHIACVKDRANQASIFPTSMKKMYRQMCAWQRMHFKKCLHVPAHIRIKYNKLKKSKHKGRKYHWENSLKEMGFKDKEGNQGIYFDPYLCPSFTAGTKEITSL